MRAVLTTTILSIAAAGTAAAADTGVIHARTVDLYQEQSHPGESLDAFVVRIAPRAVEASETARATVCGQVEGTHHGHDRTRGMGDPLPTVTGANRGELGLIQAAAELADQIEIDINYRMLHWRELARATSFDDEGEVYDFAGTATEITKQIGNAVPNRTAKALVKSLMQEAA